MYVKDAQLLNFNISKEQFQFTPIVDVVRHLSLSYLKIFFVAIDHRNIWTAGTNEADAFGVGGQFGSSLGWHGIARIENGTSGNSTKHGQIL